MSTPPKPSRGVAIAPLGEALKGQAMAAAAASHEKLTHWIARAVVSRLVQEGSYQPSPLVVRMSKNILARVAKNETAHLVYYPNRETFLAKATAADGMSWESHNGLLAEIAEAVEQAGRKVKWLSSEATDLPSRHASGDLEGQN